MGYARSGKNTVAQMIAEHSKGSTRELAFGEELKSRFHLAFPEIPHEPKPREGYELFGKLGRELDPDFWVNALTIGLMASHNIDNIVITDLRQPNEAEWCRRNGFKIVYVSTATSLRKERSVGDSHFYEVNVSEKEIENIEYDYLIANNGSLESLEQQVLGLIALEGGNDNA